MPAVSSAFGLCQNGFGTMPNEVLTAIFEQVLRYPGTSNVILPDVLKLRLVSKTFGGLALKVWVTAARHRPRLCIHPPSVKIDPERNDLQDILNVFAPTFSGRLLCSIVTGMCVIVKPIDKYKRLSERLRRCLDAGKSCDESIEQSLRQYEKVRKNQLATTRQHSLAQYRSPS